MKFPFFIFFTKFHWHIARSKEWFWLKVLIKVILIKNCSKINKTEQLKQDPCANLSKNKNPSKNRKLAEVSQLIAPSQMAQTTEAIFNTF